MPILFYTPYGRRSLVDWLHWVDFVEEVVGCALLCVMVNPHDFYSTNINLLEAIATIHKYIELRNLVRTPLKLKGRGLLDRSAKRSFNLECFVVCFLFQIQSAHTRPNPGTTVYIRVISLASSGYRVYFGIRN